MGSETSHHRPDTARPRRAGVLIPLFSLRTQTGWGVGEIPDLARMVAWAREAELAVVQLLPVNEVRGGETSPYSASTAFAIDPVYLGLDECEDFVAAGGRAALSPADQRLLDEVAACPTVDWQRVRSLKARAFRRAFQGFLEKEWNQRSARAMELRRFREEHDWLAEHGLYCVLHDRLAKHWQEWPAELRDRVPAALSRVIEESVDELLFHCWLQWQLDGQWHKARSQVRVLGVDFMGDLPFVVSSDSSDVWNNRGLFRLDMRVGAPPDPFSPTGQDWGLPLYDWHAMEHTGFRWMRQRASRAGEMFGLFRVDHVIGMYRTYYRSADGRKSGFSPSDEDAQIRLGETLLSIIGGFGQVVAEDLGALPEFLRPSLARLGLPGYRVLRWEKTDVWRDGRKETLLHDPAAWPAISVATSGTHDTEMQAEWWDSVSPDERRLFTSLPGLHGIDPHRRFDDQIRDALLHVLYSAPSELCLLPFQDLLGSRERVNVPGTVNDSNWTYRMPTDVDTLRADRATTARLAQLGVESGRQVDRDCARSR
jgi:4-alpha-glucanotransferase